MNQDFKCWLGLHKYRLYKEEPLVDVRGNTVGSVIICQCENCGKIRKYELITTKII